MLDKDLATLYGVETKTLNRAVQRNNNRFPEDFMFQLNQDEFDRLRCQFGTSKVGRGGRRYLPYVFTEHGIERMEKKNDEQFQQVFSILECMIEDNAKPKSRIGYLTEAKDSSSKKKAQAKRKRRSSC